MNQKELAEIRRRFKLEKNNIGCFYGCYVNEKREIIATFEKSATSMSEEENEMYLGLLKRGISGSLGKNLLDIEFETATVADSDEHRLLMKLRTSELKDKEAVETLYRKIIEHLHIEENYVILLCFDAYDVPFRGGDGRRLEDVGEDVFYYFVCSICPVKKTKPGLHYNLSESAFTTNYGNRVIGSPEVGFMFPCFDDRATNIYNALYYTRKADDCYESLIESLFGSEAPLPTAIQQESFQGVLTDVLGEHCQYDVVQSVHEQLYEMVETHKINKEIEPLHVTKSHVKQMLACSGVETETLVDFDEKFDEAFGKDLFTNPANLMEINRFEVQTPQVSIKVKPECSNMVETRVIDGCSYIMIRADQGITVNGVDITVKEPQAEQTEE